MWVNKFNLLIAFPTDHPHTQAVRKALRWVGLHHADQPLLVTISGENHEILTTQFNTAGERMLARRRILADLQGVAIEIVMEDDVGYGNAPSKTVRGQET